ncbi:MAG: lytic transglycosylase domain-containing protein [Actinomycetes bacterium]
MSGALLAKAAAPAVVIIGAGLLASMPTRSTFVMGASPPPARADVGPVDGGGPADLSLPLPLREPHETQAPQPVTPSDTGPGTLTAVPAIQISGNAAGIPGNVLRAYRAAAATINRTDPSCHLPWSVLAGIGKVESGHARGGALDANGRTLAPILGPILSGGPHIAAISDTDGGRYDGNTTWDRAVGPMQFIPSSWANHAADGNGDGKADPSNIYDATLAAAGYLCTGGRDLSNPADLRSAVFGYNHSQAYVTAVLAWAKVYDQGSLVVTTAATSTSSATGSATPTASSKRAGTTAGKGDHGATTDKPTPTPSSAATTSPTAPPSPSPAAVEGAAGVPSTSPSPSSGPQSAGTPADSGTPAGPTSEPTVSSSPSHTPSSSPSATSSSGTSSPSKTATPSETPTASKTPSPSSSPSDSSTSCPTPTGTDTPTPTATASASATPDPCATVTAPAQSSAPSQTPSP